MALARATVQPFTIYLTNCPHCGFQENYGRMLPRNECIAICGECGREYLVIVPWQTAELPPMSAPDEGDEGAATSV